MEYGPKFMRTAYNIAGQLFVEAIKHRLRSNITVTKKEAEEIEAEISRRCAHAAFQLALDLTKEAESHDPNNN